MKKFELKRKLQGTRIYLKKHEEELAKTMFNYVDQDRERLRQFLPWVDQIKRVSDEAEFIENTHKCWLEMSSFAYGIFKSDDDTYMGNIGVHNILWEHESCEIGYWILRSYEGKGYVTEALKVLEAHLFEEGFNRVQILCSDKNERSKQVPKRANYKFEGLTRQDAFELGSYRNTETFSKLTSDYILEVGTPFIRRARKALDYKKIGIVHHQSWMETYPNLLPDSYLKKRSEESSIKRWQNILDNERDQSITFILVDQDENALGFIRGGKARDHYEGLDGELYALYVLEDSQKKGLGKKIFEIFKVAMKESGFKAFYLWVLENNLKAQQFYEEMGGEKAWMTKEALFDDLYLKEYLYRWTL
jgi:RimJ/RimL family protein N-acetyltransferase